MCPRASGSPEGDKKFDEETIKNYKEANPGRYIEDRLNELETKLFWCFFDISWEGGYAGAIPIRIRNESEVYSSMYPRNGDGRSQLSLSYGKPHKGI